MISRWRSRRRGTTAALLLAARPERPGAKMPWRTRSLYYTEGLRAEGPAYDGTTNSLLFTDVAGENGLPPGRAFRADLTSGVVSTLDVSASAGYNGLMVSPIDGSLIGCDYFGTVRRVVRLTLDVASESITAGAVLADEYQGRPLNGPNDLTMRSDGLIYFSDPGLFSASPATKPQAHNVYSIAPPYGNAHLSAVYTFQGGAGPANGLALSPNESTLYVARTLHQSIYAFTVASDGSLSNGRIIARGGVVGYSDGLAALANGVLLVASNRGWLAAIETGTAAGGDAVRAWTLPALEGLICPTSCGAHMNVLSVPYNGTIDSRIFVTMGGGSVMVACADPADPICNFPPPAPPPAPPPSPPLPVVPVVIISVAAVAGFVGLCALGLLVLACRKGRASAKKRRAGSETQMASAVSAHSDQM